MAGHSVELLLNLNDSFSGERFFIFLRNHQIFCNHAQLIDVINFVNLREYGVEFVLLIRRKTNIGHGRKSSLLIVRLDSFQLWSTAWSVFTPCVAIWPMICAVVTSICIAEHPSTECIFSRDLLMWIQLFAENQPDLILRNMPGSSHSVSSSALDVLELYCPGLYPCFLWFDQNYVLSWIVILRLSAKRVDDGILSCQSICSVSNVTDYFDDFQCMRSEAERRYWGRKRMIFRLHLRFDHESFFKNIFLLGCGFVFVGGFSAGG